MNLAQNYPYPENYLFADELTWEQDCLMQASGGWERLLCKYNPWGYTLYDVAGFAAVLLFVAVLIVRVRRKRRPMIK